MSLTKDIWVNGVRTVVNLTNEEIAESTLLLEEYNEKATRDNLQALRNERNKRLADTDWWELPTHAPMSAERSAYRQALRDITETYSSIFDVVFPEKPA